LQGPSSCEYPPWFSCALCSALLHGDYRGVRAAMGSAYFDSLRRGEDGKTNP
jgi:hypothetical protein